MISGKPLSINQFRVTSNLHKFLTFNKGVSVLI